MSTSPLTKTLTTVARRGGMALTVAVAGIGASLGISSPAQAASTSICAVTPIPAGWVATSGYANDRTCGYLNRWQITNELSPGMTVCAAGTLPAGWYVGSIYANDRTCANLHRYHIYPY